MFVASDQGQTYHIGNTIFMSEINIAIIKEKMMIIGRRDTKERSLSIFELQASNKMVHEKEN